MQTLNIPATHTTQIHKVCTILILAACVTFGLLAAMHKLISSNEIARLETTAPPIISLHFNPEEEITRERPKLKPIEKPLVQPDVMPELPIAETEPNLDPGLFAANFTEPSLQIGIKPSFSQEDGAARPIVRVRPKYPAAAELSAASNTDLCGKFDMALLSLAFEQREAFCLQQEGFSLQDIANITHSPLETVKSRLRYAKNTLRKTLAQPHSNGTYDD